MILYLFIILIILCRNKIKNVYQAYKAFKGVIDPENKKNCCTVLFDICKFGYTIYTLKPVESFNNHVKIPYEYKDKEYFLLLKKPRGIIPIDTITDENGNDVFETVLPYLGPNLDCHGAALFPCDFGLKKLTIRNMNEKEWVFEEDDKISI